MRQRQRWRHSKFDGNLPHSLSYSLSITLLLTLSRLLPSLSLLLLLLSVQVDDLWSVMHFLVPDYLGALTNTVLSLSSDTLRLVHHTAYLMSDVFRLIYSSYCLCLMSDIARCVPCHIVETTWFVIFVLMSPALLYSRCLSS
jgi:hypothetical protein